jgi:hypothetical protein
VRGVNFWPSENVDAYLGLQGRVEDRAIAIATAGSEVPNITDKVRDRLKDDVFQDEQEARMLEHLKTSWEDLEDQTQTLSFSDLSLEIFRQDLLKELNQQHKVYDDMPLGIYTGFKTQGQNLPSGMVALLGYPSRKNGARTPYKRHNLIYIDADGKAIYDKPGEVLQFLSNHQSENRFVPEAIDANEPQAIKILSDSVKKWMRHFSEGDALDNFITGIQSGDLITNGTINDANNFEEQYDPENCDLILWFTISHNL